MLLFTLSQSLAVAVALVTDHVLGNRAMLHEAMINAVTPACIVTSLCGFAGRRRFAALRKLTQA